MGSGVADKAESLGKYGAEKVYVVDNAHLKDFNPDGYVKALSELVSKHQPHIVLAGNTAFTEDYLPRVAANFSKIINVLEVFFTAQSSATSYYPFGFG